MKKRFFALLLVLCLSLALLPAAAFASTPANIGRDAVDERIETLKSALKGKYFTLTGKAGDRASMSDVRKESWFKNAVGLVPSSSNSSPFEFYYDDWCEVRGNTCVGFANLVGWCIFAQTSTDTVTFSKMTHAGFTSQTLNQALPGDIIAFGNGNTFKHAGIYLSHDSTGVTVLDCNYGTANLIREHKITYTGGDGWKNVTISRADNYDTAAQSQTTQGTKTQYRYHHYRDSNGNASLCPYYGKSVYHSTMTLEYTDWLDAPLTRATEVGALTHVNQGAACKNCGCVDPSCDTERYTDGSTRWYYQETRTVTVPSTDPTPAHRHSAKTYHPTAATCQDKGISTTFYYCAGCGKYYRDSALTREITESQAYDLPVDPNNHVGETELRGKLAATANAAGYTGDVYCKSCGKIVTKGKAIPAASLAAHTGTPDVPLHALDYFYGKDLVIVEWDKDNLGNTYDVSILRDKTVDITGTSNNFHNVYKLNGMYECLSGTFYQRYDYRGTSDKTLYKYTATLKIYCDDVLKFSAQMKAGVEPIYFEIDLTNVSTLKIDFGGSDGPTAALGDCGLWKVPGLDDGQEEKGNLNRFVPVNRYNNNFTDISAAQWYYENVKAAYKYGLMVGVSANEFNATGNVTVAEAITMACRLHSIFYTGSENFTQNGGVWYQVYVDYARANGLLDNFEKLFGYGDYTRAASRAEFAVLFAAALPADALEETRNIAYGEIPDVYDASYAAPVYLLYRAGVLSGADEAGTFYPNSTISRAEAAAIVTRMARPELRSH